MFRQRWAVDEEVPLTVRFRGATIGSFWADLVVASTVIVEVKATAAIDPYAEDKR